MHKRFLPALLILCMVLSLLPISILAETSQIISQGECGASEADNVHWTLDSNGVLTISGTGAIKYGSPTSLPPWPTNIKSVIITSGVTNIPIDLFWKCTDLISIDIPDSVTDIQGSAFARCEKLININVDKNNTCYCSSNNVLFNKDKTRLVRYPATHGSYEIPNTVCTIGYCAFSNCANLTDIIIPNSVTDIEGSAFAGCKNLSKIEIPGSVNNIETWAFLDCSGLKMITISDGVESIANAAFAGCSGLTQVTIPGSISSLSSNIFESCSALTHIAIQEGIQNIEGGTFINLDSLKSVAFPKSLSEIKRGAFDGCNNLNTVYYAGDETSWKKINIGTGNAGLSLNQVTFVYNSTGPSALPYALIYDLNGGTGKILEECWLAGQTVTVDSTIPTKNGYTFKGWSSGTTIYQPGDTFVMPDQSVTLTAVWESAVPLPAGITRLYPANGSTYDFANSTADTRPRIFYDREVADFGGRAQLDFSRGTLEIRCASNDELVYSVEETTLSTGDSGVSNQIAIWAVDGKNTAVRLEDVATVLKSNTEYYVTMPAGFIKFKDGTTSPSINKNDWTFKTKSSGSTEPAPNSYSLIYNYGSYGPYPSTSHSAGETINIPTQIPVKPGYKFKGWSDGETTYQPGDSFIMPAHDVTLLAMWESPSLTYDLDGGEGEISGNGICIEMGSAVTIDLSIPKKDGYTFMYWADNSIRYQPGDSFTMPDRDVVLKAVWKGLPHFVRYNLDGGTGNIPSEEQHLVGDTVSVTSIKPTKAGYIFIGWSDGANTYLSDATGTAFTMPNSDVTLTAVYSRVVETFVAEALKYVGDSETQFEEATKSKVANGSWCSDFIGVCAAQVGISQIIPREPAGYKLSKKIIEAGGQVVETPQKGDIATFKVTNSKTWGHVGIVCDVDTNYVYIVHGNWHSHVCAPSGYSNNGKKCVKNYSNCGKWPLKTLTNQGQTIISFTRPAWETTNAGESASWSRVDKYACPIDVSYTYSGETLDSATNQLTTSFGNMVIDKENESITVVLYNNCDADIKITGTDIGNMTLTSTFLKDGAPVDFRTFENVPITPNTIGQLYAYDSAATELLDIYSSNQFVESWIADKNEKVSAASKEATNWRFSEQSAANNLEGENISTSSGDSDSDHSYSINVQARITGGTVKVTPTRASENHRVTVTVKPNSGYTLEELTVTDSKGKKLALSDKGDGMYTFIMPKSKVDISAKFVRQQTTPVTSSFTDIQPNAYYAEAVAWAVEKGITNGTGENKFSPETACTRAQIVTFLWRAAGSPTADTSVTFNDVVPGSYYYDAVQWAASQGIVTGTGAGMFSPDAPCTRAQAVTFLYRYEKSPSVNGDSPFTDVAVSAYYGNAVLWAYGKNITTGTSEGMFSPDGVCTRSQIVTFLFRDMA